MGFEVIASQRWRIFETAYFCLLGITLAVGAWRLCLYHQASTEKAIGYLRSLPSFINIQDSYLWDTKPS